MKDKNRSQDFENNNENRGLIPYLNPLAVWGLSFGCAVGWGAFVMPGNTFLPMAGPVGSLIGLLLGAMVMLIIAVSYNYMMNLYPDSGGAFTFARMTFGYDHGFLAGWFLILTYIAVLWANLTALSLIVRQVFGNVLMWGFHYSLFDFDVYMGEVLVEIVFLIACGALCIYGKRLAGNVQGILALILIGGIVLLFVLVMAGTPNTLTEIDPKFFPGKSPIFGIISLVALAPWAFIGFENISHSAEEFRFPIKKSFGIMLGALGASFLGYALPTLIATVAHPDQFDTWYEYVQRLGTLNGMVSMPVFNGVKTIIGQTGLMILGLTVFAGITTGIIGNMIAVSRLLYNLGIHDVIPDWFSQTMDDGSLKNAIKFIVLVSIPIPFFGRAPVGWIVDVTTIGATVSYGYTCAATWKKAAARGNKKISITGLVGLIIAILFSAWLIVPNIWAVSALASESYLILAVWGILGFVVFRYVIGRDTKLRFGKSTVVWITMLIMVFFTSLIWMRLATHSSIESLVRDIANFYRRRMEMLGIDATDPKVLADRAYLENIVSGVGSILLTNSLVQLILIAAALGIMFSMYSVVRHREEDMKIAKLEAEESSRAKSTFLSNMSHDIRTPMNAIIGYVNLADKDDVDMETLKEYLKKIKGSSQHLLALINDVLEMSRIESGKMEIELAPGDINEVMDDVRDMFATQMAEKDITYTVSTEGVEHRAVLVDKNRLNRVLLNLISNAFKFTPEGGEVKVSLRQLSDVDLLDFESHQPETVDTGSQVIVDGNAEIIGRGLYELRVKDSGIGMTPAFASKVFEAFERERTSTVSGIQGTGLGMSITKNIVDLMGGEIVVNTAPEEGAEFVVKLILSQIHSEEIEEAIRNSDKAKSEQSEPEEVNFTGTRLLLVEDMDINREIATMMLTGLGFEIEPAVNGQEALDKVSASKPGYFDAVLMDIQMPVMDGYEATRRIRKLEDETLSNIPVIAMTANAFSEDVQKALDAGMNAHIAKPIDMDQMTKTLRKILVGGGSKLLSGRPGQGQKK